MECMRASPFICRINRERQRALAFNPPAIIARIRGSVSALASSLYTFFCIQRFHVLLFCVCVRLCISHLALWGGVFLTQCYALFPLFSLVPDNLIAYSVPRGVQRGLDIDLADEVYDGREDGDRLVGGLGQLVDGQRGTDNYRTDIHGFGKGALVVVFWWRDRFERCFGDTF